MSQSAPHPSLSWHPSHPGASSASSPHTDNRERADEDLFRAFFPLFVFDLVDLIGIEVRYKI